MAPSTAKLRLAALLLLSVAVAGSMAARQEELDKPADAAKPAAVQPDAYGRRYDNSERHAYHDTRYGDKDGYDGAPYDEYERPPYRGYGDYKRRPDRDYEYPWKQSPYETPYPVEHPVSVSCVVLCCAEACMRRVC